jgi:hypothetical protein
MAALRITSAGSSTGARHMAELRKDQPELVTQFQRLRRCVDACTAPGGVTARVNDVLELAGVAAALAENGTPAHKWLDGCCSRLVDDVFARV